MNRRYLRAALKALPVALLAALVPWLVGMFLTMEIYSFMEPSPTPTEGAGFTRMMMLVFFVFTLSALTDHFQRIGR